MKRPVCIGTVELFGPRCGREAAWMSVVGPLCEACAEARMAAIREGKTLANAIAEKKGISIETLLSKFQRLQ